MEPNRVGPFMRDEGEVRPGFGFTPEVLAQQRELTEYGEYPPQDQEGEIIDEQ